VTEQAGSPSDSKAAAAGMVAFITAWATFDGIILGLPILVISIAWLPLVVFIVGAAVWALINITACRWVDRSWDTLIAGGGFERWLDKLRSKDRGKRAAEWVGRGSAVAFGVAAVLTSAVATVAVNRAATGRPTPGRLLMVVSLTPAIAWAGFFSGFAYLLQKTT
jgi:hypothetical protein